MYISDLLKINLHLFQIKIYNFRKKMVILSPSKELIVFLSLEKSKLFQGNEMLPLIYFYLIQETPRKFQDCKRKNENQNCQSFDPIRPIFRINE